MKDAEMQLDDAVPGDLRAARSESSEGRGLARSRRAEFLARYQPADRARHFGAPSFSGVDSSIVDEVRDAHAEALVAATADLGFWIAWHQAGGFEALERLGWHRTTIFRKLKRFRARFGVHPDEWNPSWISLDLERLWKAEVDFVVDLKDGRADPDDWPGFTGVWVEDMDRPDVDGPE